MDETSSCPSSVLLLQRQRPSTFRPPSRAAFVSPHLFSRDRNGLAVAVIVFRRVRPLPSCFCRVLSLCHLILRMPKRQSRDRID
jgi:hypothetical protein